MRELTTRYPAVNALRNYRHLGFDTAMPDIAEATPTGETREDHAPTKVREDLAIIIQLTVKGTAEMIVQEADDSQDGTAIFANLTSAYEQTDDDGTAYLQQIKELSFNSASSSVMFETKFKTTCNDYKNTTGEDIPLSIKWRRIRPTRTRWPRTATASHTATLSSRDAPNSSNFSDKKIKSPTQIPTRTNPPKFTYALMPYDNNTRPHAV